VPPLARPLDRPRWHGPGKSRCAWKTTAYEDTTNLAQPSCAVRADAETRSPAALVAALIDGDS